MSFDDGVGFDLVSHIVISFKRKCEDSATIVQTALFVSASLFFACALAGSDYDPEIGKGYDADGDSALGASIFPTSIITLVAGHEGLEGSVVQVKGYLAADERPIIFLTHEQCQRYSSYDGVGLEFSRKLDIDWSHYTDPDCRRVLVEGVYAYIGPKSRDSQSISFRIVQAVIRDIKNLQDISSE